MIMPGGFREWAVQNRVEHTGWSLPMGHVSAFAFSAAILLASCASTPVATQQNAQAAGYSQLRLDNEHWLVRYAGREGESRAIVERNLLFHSAELTLQSGYNWFSTAEHATDVETVVYPPPHRMSGIDTAHSREQASNAESPQPTTFDRFVSHEVITMGLGKGAPDSFHAAAVWALLSPAVLGEPQQSDPASP